MNRRVFNPKKTVGGAGKDRISASDDSSSESCSTSSEASQLPNPLGTIDTTMAYDQEFLFFHAPTEIQANIIQLIVVNSSVTPSHKKSVDFGSTEISYSSEGSEDEEEKADLFSFLSSCKSAYKIMSSYVSWIIIANLKQKRGFFFFILSIFSFILLKHPTKKIN